MLLANKAYILFKATFSAAPSVTLEDREYLPLIRRAKRYILDHLAKEKSSFTITASVCFTPPTQSLSLTKMSTFIYYPEGNPAAVNLRQRFFIVPEL